MFGKAEELPVAAASRVPAVVSRAPGGGSGIKLFQPALTGHVAPSQECELLQGQLLDRHAAVHGVHVCAAPVITSSAGIAGGQLDLRVPDADHAARH